ncbi:uncharacterized protein [Musca autumnalis]|uniref:uncharacterized protein n=1 Tax=Musca autumnalis TaxID=221902 RepID=UPI003CF7E135
MSIKDIYLSLDLIEQVKKYNCLWDHRSEDFKYYELKKKLWKKIARELHTSEDNVRRKWKNLKRSYMKYKRRLNDPNIKHVSAYRYFEELSFLDRNLQSSDGSNNNNNYDEDDTQDISYMSPASSMGDISNTFSPEEAKRLKLDETALEKKKQDEKDMENEGEEKEVNNNLFYYRSSSPDSEITTNKDNHVTVQLFQLLGKKVVQSNLSTSQINDIENSVCSLIYSKLAEYDKFNG